MVANGTVGKSGTHTRAHTGGGEHCANGVDEKDRMRVSNIACVRYKELEEFIPQMPKKELWYCMRKSGMVEK